MSDETDTGKLTPTPRRSIHSYKVTETTKQVITKNRDGTETKNISRTVEKTENGQKVENKGWNKTLVTLIKVVLFLAIIGGIAAAVLMNKDNTITFDQIEDAVKNAAHAAADKVVEEKEEIVQNTIGDV